jgi:hypothetical protein
MPQLLSQNSKLAKTSKSIGAKVMNFGIPAYRDINNKVTCPFANVNDKSSPCYSCYARKGAYIWPAARNAYQWRYEQTKLDSFVDDMVVAITKSKAKFIRVHDSGDYYSIDYINKWLAIANALPNVNFYSYTKSVKMWKDVISSGKLPNNYDIIFSQGSVQDSLVDVAVDRHAKVFPTYEDMNIAGYVDAMGEDVQATKWFNASNKVGLVFH